MSRVSLRNVVSVGCMSGGLERVKRLVVCWVISVYVFCQRFICWGCGDLSVKVPEL